MIRKGNAGSPFFSRVSGSGELVHRIQEFDWSKTPVGPLSGWPETLLSAVNLILSATIPVQVYWGAEMTTIYNDALIPFLAEKHPNALGQSAREVWREAWPLVGPQLEGVFGSGKAVSFTNVLIPLLREGELEDTWWTYSYSPIYAADGSIAGILNLAQNTTEIVSLSQRLNGLLEDTSEGVMTIDRDWRVSYMNPVARRTALPVEDIVGKSIWESFPGFIFEGSPWVKNYRRAMEERITSSFEAFYGEPINVWLTVQAKPSKDGITLFFRDITKDKQSSAALLQTEKLAAVGRLSASIAHEINNPLESVTNLLYLIRGTKDQRETEEYLDLAERELRRVSVISNQTLRFQKQSTAPQPTSCEDLFTSVLSIHHGRIANARVTVEKRKKATRPVHCFDGEIRQVLNNLIGNAADAMAPNGGRLLVRSSDATHWPTNRRGLRLTVADTGSGISPAALGRIFEPFFTTKGDQGNGLGLWVSREIVERHQGDLRVRSTQTKGTEGTKGRSGTVFTLFLPFDAATRSESPQEAVAHASCQAAHRTKA